jgi:DNA-binding Xre family transcriptional regulator
MNFKSNLNKLLKEKKKRQYTLATELGISRSFLSSIANGTAETINIKYLKKLLTFLGCSFEDLISFDEEYEIPKRFLREEEVIKYLSLRDQEELYQTLKEENIKPIKIGNEDKIDKKDIDYLIAKKKSKV